MKKKNLYKIIEELRVSNMSNFSKFQAALESLEEEKIVINHLHERIEYLNEKLATVCNCDDSIKFEGYFETINKSTSP